MTISRIQFLNFIRKKKEVNAGENALTSSTRYYLRKFDQYGETPLFASWNWSAAFFAGAWLFYRQMYLYGFLYMMLHTASFWVFEFAMFSVLSFFLMGFLGNAFYLQFAKHKIAKGVTSRPPKGIAILLCFVFSLLIAPVTFILSMDEKNQFDGLETHHKFVYILGGKEILQHIRSIEEKIHPLGTDSKVSNESVAENVNAEVSRGTEANAVNADAEKVATTK